MHARTHTVQIFDQAEGLGYNMELLDVGGGFTGHFDACGNVMFGEIANTINKAVAHCFPPEMGVRVIAEPGRYFAGACVCVCVEVCSLHPLCDWFNLEIIHMALSWKLYAISYFNPSRLRLQGCSMGWDAYVPYGAT
jgi:hypothetical protein